MLQRGGGGGENAQVLFQVYMAIHCEDGDIQTVGYD